MRALILGLLAALAVGSAHAQDAETISKSDRAALAGPWRGTWTGGDYVYDGEMTLVVAADGVSAGAVVWTLRETPYDDERAKVGRSGVEHVAGLYSPESGALTLEGVRREDPDNIIGLESYRLVVGADFAVMTGLTANHGTWDGRFDMAR